MTPGHGGPGLSETDLGADPVARFLAWQEEARAAGIAFPEAAALGTADADRRPAVRYVLVKAVDERGFTFFTNRESRKARHLAENPNAALAFYWREVDRQVCVTGAAAPIADDESAAYFRWQCGANTASLRDSPGGGTLAQIGYGEGVDVLGGDGGAWWYVRRLATGQLGWTLKQYYCQ